jgi:hypothetical protein
VEWVVREGVGAGGREMTQALYAHMNNKRKKNGRKLPKSWEGCGHTGHEVQRISSKINPK